MRGRARVSSSGQTKTKSTQLNNLETICGWYISVTKITQIIDKEAHVAESLENVTDY